MILPAFWKCTYCRQCHEDVVPAGEVYQESSRAHPDAADSRGEAPENPRHGSEGEDVVLVRHTGERAGSSVRKRSGGQSMRVYAFMNNAEAFAAAPQQSTS